MKKTFLAFCTIGLLAGILIMITTEHYVDKQNYYAAYIVLVNIGAALLTISVISLVAKYVTIHELAQQFAFIHDRERTGIQRTFDNWQDCIADVRFYDRLSSAQDILFVGYSHAKTLLVLDDAKIISHIEGCKRIRIFIADGSHHVHGNATNQAMLARFPVDSCINAETRLKLLRDSLPAKHKKKIHIYKYNPETVNVLSIKVIDGLGLIRLVGLRQAGFSSPFIQFGKSGSLRQFIDEYVLHLTNVATEV